MRRIWHVALGLALVGLVIASCTRAVPSIARGHEDETPHVVPPVVQPVEASREPETTVKARPASECLDPAEALASVRKTAPDAMVTRHFKGALATNFIARFNAERGQGVTGDEVIVLDSSKYAETAVALFVAHHCVLRTLAFQPATPNHEDR